MVAGIVSSLLGGLLSLFMLVLGLLPTVDVSALPVSLPDPVTRALSALNWFVPIDTLISVLTLWIALLLVLNAVLLIVHVVQTVTKA